jgi:hypothetical protein
MQLTLIAASDLAARLREGGADPVRAAIAKAKATLYPPPIDDPASTLSRTFIIEAPDRAGQALAKAIAALPGVEACFAKPGDAPP